MDLAFEKALREENATEAVSAEVIARCRNRAKAMLANLRKYNPKQAELVLDPSPHIAGICPRRAGKSYAGASAALIQGEAKPGSISIIISLNLKQLRRLYWKGGASGLFTLDKQFKLNLTFSSTALMWEHENGSIGYLLGAEDDDQLEVIRGLEADLYLIDECKSFHPSVLNTLIDDIIDPQLNTRRARLILIGTPGFIASGPFYQATCPEAKDEEHRPYLVKYGEKDPWGRTPQEDLLWSLHSWTLQENTAKPHQWTEALKKKRAKKWADDSPVWRREYLGHWTAGGSGMVFRYGAEKSTGKVTWQPQITDDNPSGLPAEGAPWRFIAGMDFGYEAPTALVVAAYSSKLKQLRHVADYSRRHLLPPDIEDLLNEAQEKYGRFERIFADAANLGITLVKHLEARGFPIEKSEKREKLDHIELVNGSFSRGEIKIIPGSILERQLLTVAWALGDEDEDEILDLARRGKLKEDDAIPNDSTDAFLYMYRGSLHHFVQTEEEEEPDPESPEGIAKWEREQLKKARDSFKTKKDHRLGSNGFDRAPGFVRNALARTQWTTHSTLLTSIDSGRRFRS